MSDDKEPEPPAEESQPTRKRISRKRSVRTKTPVTPKTGRTASREARRKPAEHTASAVKRRKGRQVPTAKGPDTLFWLSIIIAIGFVVVGIMEAAKGNGVAVFTAFSAAITTIIATVCRQGKKGK